METIEKHFLELIKKESSAELLSLALTPKHSGGQDNERLEFLGNAVLNMRLAEAAYNMDVHHTPATMSLMCNYLRSNPVLVMAGREGGLAATISRQGPKDGKVTDKMVSTAFEAIVGALYVEAGYQSAVQLIDRFLLVDRFMIGSLAGKGAITELKELADRDRGMIVTHETSELTENDTTIFTHVTTVNGKVAKGEGRTKKGAEAEAAARALVLVSPSY